MVVRRLALVFSILFCASLALAAAAVAAGGPLGPGDYTFSSTGANATFGGAKGGPPQPTFSVFVNHGLNSFQPEDNQGSGTVMDSTMVQFSQFNPSGVGGFGCFLISAGDFKVSKDLQSASLHTVLTTPNCPGIGKPLGVAQTAGPVPPPGGGGLVLPIKVDLTWSGVGVVSTLRDRFTFTCLSHMEIGTNTFRDSLGGNSSGTIGSTSGLTTLAADVSSQDGQLEVQGNVTPPCFGK
jgi:hypothetical protein